MPQERAMGIGSKGQARVKEVSSWRETAEARGQQVMKPGQDGEDMFATFEKRPCSLEGRECEAHVRVSHWLS